MKQRKWKVIYNSGVHVDHLLCVEVLGVGIEAYVNEIVGDRCTWEVHGRTGNDAWRELKSGKAKTPADAKAKAEAELDKVIGKMIDGLTKWRGNPIAAQALKEAKA